MQKESRQQLTFQRGRQPPGVKAIKYLYHGVGVGVVYGLYPEHIHNHRGVCLGLFHKRSLNSTPPEYMGRLTPLGKRSTNNSTHPPKISTGWSPFEKVLKFSSLHKLPRDYIGFWQESFTSQFRSVHHTD